MLNQALTIPSLRFTKRFWAVWGYGFVCAVLLGGLWVASWQDGWLTKPAQAADLLQPGFSHAQYYLYVTKVNVGENNYLYINVRGNFSTAHGCNGPWFVRSKYQLSDPRTQVQLQEALTSFQLKKQVYVETYGCDGGYPIMTKLQVEQQ